MPSILRLQQKILGAFALTVLLTLSALIVSGNATAESFEEKFGKMIPDDVAAAALQAALHKIDYDVCGHDPSCSPTTDEELRNPPISTHDARAAMVFGIKSALAEWCGLDSKRSFLPMIAFGKEAKGFNDRQLAIMSLIHGDFMARQYGHYKRSKTQCPATLKTQLNNELTKLN